MSPRRKTKPDTPPAIAGCPVCKRRPQDGHDSYCTPERRANWESELLDPGFVLAPMTVRQGPVGDVVDQVQTTTAKLGPSSPWGDNAASKAKRVKGGENSRRVPAKTIAAREEEPMPSATIAEAIEAQQLQLPTAESAPHQCKCGRGPVEMRTIRGRECSTGKCTTCRREYQNAWRAKQKAEIKAIIETATPIAPPAAAPAANVPGLDPLVDLMAKVGSMTVDEIRTEIAVASALLAALNLALVSRGVA